MLCFNPAGILPLRRKIQNEQTHQNVPGDTSKKNISRPLSIGRREKRRTISLLPNGFPSATRPGMLFQSVTGRKPSANKDGLATDFVI